MSWYRVIWLACIFVFPALGGCLGGEARTQWAYEQTQLSDLAELSRSGKGVRVAILDTGIDLEHPGFAHLTDGRRENGELVAFKDFMKGVEGIKRAYDDDGHGTHIAGIISAQGSTLSDKLAYGGIDLKGGAPHVDLLVAKVCSDTCHVPAIVAAIEWVLLNNADIINLSLGGNRSIDVRDELCLPALPRDQCDLARAINRAIDRGVIVIAAAGNEGPNNKDVAMPGDIPGVISVGASQENMQVWTNSNRGFNQCRAIEVSPSSPSRCYPNMKPELVAPGVEILSTWTGGGYAKATGTSQATPFVTSAVALILEGRPNLTARSEVVRLKEVLVQTAAPLEGQSLPHDSAAGYGLVQALAAYQAYR